MPLQIRSLQARACFRLLKFIAQRFYQRRGYEIVARGEHRLSSGQAMEAIRMRKRLVPPS